MSVVPLCLNKEHAGGNKQSTVLNAITKNIGRYRPHPFRDHKSRGYTTISNVCFPQGHISQEAPFRNKMMLKYNQPHLKILRSSIPICTPTSLLRRSVLPLTSLSPHIICTLLYYNFHTYFLPDWALHEDSVYVLLIVIQVVPSLGMTEQCSINVCAFKRKMLHKDRGPQCPL